jgi:hypothetical protein
MRAKWIDHNPHVQLPEGLQTIGAMWWPGRYYWVSTVPTRPHGLSVLLPSLDSTTQPQYITQVFRCDKTGYVKRINHVHYQEEYKTLQEAKAGHERVVEQLAARKLNLQLVKHEF